MQIPPPFRLYAGAVPLDGMSAEMSAGLDARARTAESHAVDDPVIVIGGGPSGLRVAQDVARRGFPVVLFNAERWQPYNRVKLTPFLAGEVQVGRIYQSDAFPAGAPVMRYDGHTIVRVDRAARTVENAFGRRWRYRKLVLCVGAHAHIPPIPGNDLSGVYRFRNFDDVERLVARAMRSRRTAVIGGGLLGLEAARGMARRGVDVVVLEHEHRLMARQLDADSGALLADQVRAMGIDVRTGCSVQQIDGAQRVERIILAEGPPVACDTVIICTGIRPNIDLARDAGIAIGRGITINDAMQTSDPDIYAVGECAEHDGHIYGLVAPGLEQAATAAAHLAGEPARYRGSVPTTKLKLVGVDVFSMGDVEQIDQRSDVRRIIYQGGGTYRCLVLRGLRLVGAIGVGEWPEVSRIQQAVRDRAMLLPWQTWRFKRDGRLYRAAQPASVAFWPAAATVCNCTGVTRGQLGDAISQGASSIEALMRETSASTVCGTCRPLLHDLLGGEVRHEPVFGARMIGSASAIALAASAAAILAPPWPYSPSVAAGPTLDVLWTDGGWKQVTGFTLVGLSALVALLSVRKRIALRWLGDYRIWRIVHAGIGAAALAVLFLHTGFDLGHNLNRWLMLTFLGIAVLGATTGIVTAREHTALAKGKTSLKPSFVWLHILTCWPLPLLLILHVVTVYAY